MELDDVQYVQVTNRGLPRFSARYHGVEYRFDQKKPVTIPMAAARHIFGVGAEDAEQVKAFHRLGWLTQTADLERAREKFRTIRFEPVDQVFELTSARKAREAGKAAAVVTETTEAPTATVPALPDASGEAANEF
jgi:hypothetical protein